MKMSDVRHLTRVYIYVVCSFLWRAQIWCAHTHHHHLPFTLLSLGIWQNCTDDGWVKLHFTIWFSPIFWTICWPGGKPVWLLADILTWPKWKTTLKISFWYETSRFSKNKNLTISPRKTHLSFKHQVFFPLLSFTKNSWFILWCLWNNHATETDGSLILRI